MITQKMRQSWAFESQVSTTPWIAAWNLQKLAAVNLVDCANNGIDLQSPVVEHLQQEYAFWKRASDWLQK